MNSQSLFGLMAAALAAGTPADPDAPAVTTRVRVPADAPADDVPDRFRLDAHTFAATERPLFDLPHSGVEVIDVRFPSAVDTPHAANNTVYCEYYRPKKPGPFPAAVVLDILDGRQVVSRGKALWLAQNDIPAVVVILPYYGPRRPADGKWRFLSPDVRGSVDNIRQGVLDCRRAVAWLHTRPEVDAARVGVVGTSLGSFVGGLVAAADPRVSAACLLLGGGGLVDAFYDHPTARAVAPVLQLFGLTKDKLRPLIAPADPLTYAPQLRKKRLLLVAASRDEVVPPAAMTRLWEATGRPAIRWFDATHVGAAAYAFPVMREVIGHLKAGD